MFRDLSPARADAVHRAMVRLRIAPLMTVLVAIFPDVLPSAKTNTLAGAVALAIEGWR